MELVDLLPEDYRELHLALAGLVRRLIEEDEDLEEDELAPLVAAVGRELNEIREALHLAENRDSEDEGLMDEDGDGSERR